MEKFRIVFVPSSNEDLFYEFENNFRDVNAASDFAKATLVMNEGRYKEARVMSRWKSDLSFRQAVPPIIYNNNL